MTTGGTSRHHEPHVREAGAERERGVRGAGRWRGDPGARASAGSTRAAEIPCGHPAPTSSAAARLARAPSPSTTVASRTTLATCVATAVCASPWLAPPCPRSRERRPGSPCRGPAGRVVGWKKWSRGSGGLGEMRVYDWVDFIWTQAHKNCIVACGCMVS